MTPGRPHAVRSAISHRLRTVVAGSVLVAGLLAGCTAADPALAEVEAAGLTDSAELTGPVVASGVMLDPAGEPVPPGLVVVLQAWPSQDELGALDEGDQVDILHVSYARTGADGTFELRVPSDVDLDDRRVGDQVNFEITTLADDYVVAWSFPADPDDPGTEHHDLVLEALDVSTE